MTSVLRAALVCLPILCVLGCHSTVVDVDGLEVSPNQENLALDGTLYTPETQSFLRQKHWLDEVDRLDIDVARDGEACVELTDTDAGDDGADYVRYENVPIRFLLPRLYYGVAGAPDDFDAFNLMLAEYSRNSVDFPWGEPGDEMTHFQTSLDIDSAWSMPDRPYEFVANRRFRPLRMSMVNNCLGPGLFELNARDNAGEIYHAWFSFPGDDYVSLVADANGIDDVEFVREALLFRDEEVRLDLARLRDVVEELGPTDARLAIAGRSGYSSQGSRRKLAKGYVLADKGGTLAPPDELEELTAGPLQMSEFVEPGIYSIEKRREFDLRYLRDVRSAEVAVVRPKTSYRFMEDDEPPPAEFRGGRFLELRVNLDSCSIVLGNLPASMLVPQEDFAIHGFGVGVLSAGEPAERRRLLMEEGPAPSFAYLARRDGDGYVGLNSHERGLEQVFLRTRWRGDRAWWEITLTSYERIVDLVKYEVPVPPALLAEMNDYRRRYISPVFLTYRDDNVR